ncbi:hypothetical protein [Niallia sp. NCCP-28]|uniref:hypothetical protein n=1 Tax=Niallia sp. NCCP-28 TaxID=2934712 RepID=UPI00208AEFF0|nr:hypothetical protein [Niallia sp. NCCP-28]GKU84005.1 hypothetical protein NCCP28_34010 [Niallia sp. NCCP-28]
MQKKGEKDAFISLIQQNKMNLYRVAKAMLHNENDVEDAIQITILKQYTKQAAYFVVLITDFLIKKACFLEPQ